MHHCRISTSAAPAHTKTGDLTSDGEPLYSQNPLTSPVATAIAIAFGSFSCAWSAKRETNTTDYTSIGVPVCSHKSLTSPLAFGSPPCAKSSRLKHIREWQLRRMPSTPRVPTAAHAVVPRGLRQLQVPGPGPGHHAHHGVQWEPPSVSHNIKTHPHLPAFPTPILIRALNVYAQTSQGHFNRAVRNAQKHDALLLAVHLLMRQLSEQASSIKTYHASLTRSILQTIPKALNSKRQEKAGQLAQSSRKS